MAAPAARATSASLGNGPRTPRREALRHALASSAALLAASTLLSACAAAQNLVQALTVKRRIPISVCLVDGGLTGKFASKAARGLGSMLQPALLQDLAAPLQKALGAANASLATPVEVQFSTLDSTVPWFTYPTQLLNADSDPAFRVPSAVAMPDLVVATSDLFPDWLAVRATDLSPYLGSVPQDIPAAVLRHGQAYAHGRGTFQAGLPLMRIPLLCAVQPGVQAVRAGRPWTADEFTAALRALAPAFPAPNAPLPWVPYGMGVPEMAAVGSGAALAAGGGPSSKATFADGAAGEAMAAIVGWTDHRPAEQVYLAWPGTKGVAFGMLMFDGQALLSGRGPIKGGVNIPFSVPAAWSIAPVPAFAARYAVPTRTVLAMVSQNAKLPEQAAALAAALLSKEAQAELLTFDGALALRSAQALKQLAYLAPRAQGADIIVSFDHDITQADAWGPRTPANSTARALNRRDLLNALQKLSGYAAYMFDFVRTFNGPVVDLSYVQNLGPAVHPAPPTGPQVAAVLSAAEAAARSGRTYPV